MTNTNTTALTADRFAARRFYNTKGTKATVVLYLDGTEIARAGGARAERAAAVIVHQWTVEEPVGIAGLRGDYLKAVAEAQRDITKRPITTRGRGRTITLKDERTGEPLYYNMPVFSVAIAVEDEPTAEVPAVVPATEAKAIVTAEVPAPAEVPSEAPQEPAPGLLASAVADAATAAREATVARDAAILAWHREGGSLREIAEAAGLSHTAIAKIVRRDA